VVGRVVLGLFLAAVGSASAIGQGASAAVPDRELVVGVFEAPPFAIKRPSGEWRGFTVDLWKQVAGEIGLRYRLAEKNEAEILQGLADGSLDAAVGPFAATMEREQVIDFSHTYLTTGLSIAVPRRSRTERLVNLFRTLATSGAAHIIGAIALLSLLFGAAVWLAERRHNPQFPARPAPGIGSGVWWAGVTTTGVGYGDKVPITLHGRLIAITWMLVSLVLFVLVTASLTATLAVAEFEQTRDVDSLRHAVVGTLAGSASADYLRRSQVPHRLYPSYRIAIEALNAKKVDAIMFGEEILRYYAARGAGSDLQVLPQIFMSEHLAFPLPDSSTLRVPINRALRRALATTRYRDLRDQYLAGEESGE